MVGGITMTNKVSDIVTYDDTEYDLNDKEDVVELFNDLIYTINYLREEVRGLRHDVDYVSERAVFRYNSLED